MLPQAQALALALVCLLTSSSASSAGMPLDRYSLRETLGFVGTAAVMDAARDIHVGYAPDTNGSRAVDVGCGNSTVLILASLAL